MQAKVCLSHFEQKNEAKSRESSFESAMVKAFNKLYPTLEMLEVLNRAIQNKWKKCRKPAFFSAVEFTENSRQCHCMKGVA